MVRVSGLDFSEAVLERSATGDRRLARMFETHHGFVVQTLRRLGLDQDVVSDAAQQAFLVASERLEKIRPGSEASFLFGTALRVARVARRKSERYQLEPDMDSRIDPGWQDDKMAARHAALQLTDRVLRRMDPDLVSVFVLFELEGRSTGEIAGIEGIPVGTAASRLRRARQAFRAAAVRLETRASKRTPTFSWKKHPCPA